MFRRKQISLKVLHWFHMKERATQHYYWEMGSILRELLSLKLFEGYQVTNPLPPFPHFSKPDFINTKATTISHVLFHCSRCHHTSTCSPFTTRMQYQWGVLQTRSRSCLVNITLCYSINLLYIRLSK